MSGPGEGLFTKDEILLVAGRAWDKAMPKMLAEIFKEMKERGHGLTPIQEQLISGALEVAP